MTLNYNATVINGRLQVVINNIDAGASTGAIRLLNSTNQTVALINLIKPSATISGGVLTFSGLPLAAPLTFISGQIVSADIEDSNANVVASGLTVGNSTAYDIVMGNTSVSSGQIISLTYAAITGR